ncbi:MAG: PD-(D/E)XK nuclease family protein [Candidatus ainarchaeum sp.]|nr:PD-(D/E)XK nuclease family protein [Candidatus ainarchaeum sp.]
MRYSHSSMETFRNCPLQFKYKYIEKVDIPIKNNIEAFMGSMVHNTLEKLYTDLKYNKLLSLEEVLDYYNKSWTDNFSFDKVEIIREGYTEENYKSLGQDYLKNYYNTYKPFNQGKTIGLEMQVNISLYDKERQKTYDLIGYIDRLSLVSDNHIEIIDYKTNNSAKTQQEVDVDKQLALYSIAIKEKFPFVEKIDLCWFFLSAGIKQVSTRTVDDLEKLKQETIEIIREIEDSKQKNNFPGKPSALCDWCAFRSICPFKAHDVITKNLPENEYLKEEGVFLVDKYQEFTEKKKALLEKIDPEIEKLKEAIINYSKKNNLEKLFGKEKSLIVKEYSSFKIPEKKSKEREELEALLKENNFWPLVSDLSYIEISNLIKNGFFESSFKEKLLKYLKEEKINRLYLNKK